MFLKGDDELLFNDVIVDVDDELYSIRKWSKITHSCDS